MSTESYKPDPKTSYKNTSTRAFLKVNSDSVPLAATADIALEPTETKDTVFPFSRDLISCDTPDDWTYLFPNGNDESSISAVEDANCHLRLDDSIGGVIRGFGLTTKEAAESFEKIRRSGLPESPSHEHYDHVHISMGAAGSSTIKTLKGSCPAEGMPYTTLVGGDGKIHGTGHCGCGSTTDWSDTKASDPIGDVLEAVRKIEGDL